MKYLKTYEQKQACAPMPSTPPPGPAAITFKEWLKDNPQDINTTEINCNGSRRWDRFNLINLNGIKKFKNLINLDCRNNKLTSLPDLSELKNLKLLNCSYNNLTSLPDLSELKNLEQLYCQNNKLISLPDLSQLKNLKYLHCDNNNLTSLPDLSDLKNLITLYCDENNLTSLPDLSEIENLKNLTCCGNYLPFKCSKNINNLKEYLNWHKETYPWMWDAKTFNL